MDAGAASDAGGLPSDPTAVRWAAVEVPDDGLADVWGAQVASSTDGRAVVFGGSLGVGPGRVVLGDTWLYDAGEEELQRLDVTGPAPRYCGCAAWDEGRGVVLMTGGRASDGVDGLPHETWAFHVGERRWSLVELADTPTYNMGCAMAYSASRGAIYRFGGGNAVGFSNQMFRYDSEVSRWVALEASGPDARFDSVLLPHDGGEQLLLFAGSYGSEGAAFYSDVWLFDTASETWSELQGEGETPPGRRAPWASITPDGGGMWAGFGMDGHLEALDDFWYLDFNTVRWTQIATGSEPGARALAVALPARSGGLGRVLGGRTKAGTAPGLWELLPSE